jgi:hypothetical protein
MFKLGFCVEADAMVKTGIPRKEGNHAIKVFPKKEEVFEPLVYFKF